VAAPLQIAAAGAPASSAPQRPFDFMKMYILVRDDIPLGFAMVAVAHASLAGYLKFRDTPEVARWLDGPFFKAVCKVNATEFDNAKQVADHVVLTESALDGREVAIVFKPREEWPKMFKFLRLYREAPAIA
jgi:hypothetical protein